MECIASLDNALIASVGNILAEAGLSVLHFQRVAYVDMLDRDVAVLARLDELGGYEVCSYPMFLNGILKHECVSSQAVKNDREALQSLFTSVCDSEESARAATAAHLCREYECCAGAVPDVTPASLIRHPTLRLLWYSVFSNTEEVPIQDWISSLVGFAYEVLQLGDYDVASMFSATSKSALAKQLSNSYPVNSRVGYRF